MVLCATQRCGSTLVVEDMRNTKVLGQPEEWFVPWDPAKTDTNWSNALASVTKRATGENGVSAIKVMANQLLNVDACLATFVQTEYPGTSGHFAKVFGDAKWVWLRRNDIVSQAISRIMARQTGINHATGKAEDEHFAGNLAKGYNPDYNEKANYRYGAILRQVTAISLENLAWVRFFEKHGIQPLELVYEEVIADPDMGHLDRLAALAGVEGPLTKVPRKMVKVGNKRNEEWRERFFEDAESNRFMPATPGQG